MADNLDQKASLGCGTLILIALIVLIFGNRGKDDLEEQLKRIEDQLEKIEQKLDAQKPVTPSK